MEDATPLEKMLSEWLKAGLEEAESWGEMERVARERLQEMGRRAFERMLADERTQRPVQSVRCECGAEADYIRHRKATLRTVLGKVTYQRAYYVCAACRKGTYPLDERMGLRPNAMSGELERLAGMMGVERPFEQGSRLFEELTLVSLSDHSLDKAAQAYGEEQMKREAEWEEEAYDLERVLERRRTDSHPGRGRGRGCRVA